LADYRRVKATIIASDYLALATTAILSNFAIG
jgi:hypothetical protein